MKGIYFGRKGKGSHWEFENSRAFFRLYMENYSPLGPATFRLAM